MHQPAVITHSPRATASFAESEIVIQAPSDSVVAATAADDIEDYSDDEHHSDTEPSLDARIASDDEDEHERREAAVKVQALGRGHIARRGLHNRHAAATDIQRTARGQQARRQVGDLRTQAAEQQQALQQRHEEAAVKMQAVTRGHLARREAEQRRGVLSVTVAIEAAAEPAPLTSTRDEDSYSDFEDDGEVADEVEEEEQGEEAVPQDEPQPRATYTPTVLTSSFTKQAELRTPQATSPRRDTPGSDPGPYRPTPPTTRNTRSSGHSSPRHRVAKRSPRLVRVIRQLKPAFGSFYKPSATGVVAYGDAVKSLQATSSFRRAPSFSMGSKQAAGDDFIDAARRRSERTPGPGAHKVVMQAFGSQPVCNQQAAVAFLPARLKASGANSPRYSFTRTTTGRSWRQKPNRVALAATVGGEPGLMRTLNYGVHSPGPMKYSNTRSTTGATSGVGVVAASAKVHRGYRFSTSSRF